MPSLDWIGKKAVVEHHKQVPFHLLRCNDDLSVGEPGTGNLLVQGDNLLALKALLPYYAGKVKCIYIDPPYNTGRETWIYNDNVTSPEMREWLGKVVGKEAEDLSRHDKWLCMMYPRLMILKDFLKEDGAVFVSIDDNEITSLRMLMDEIFGKNNFIAQFVWNTEGHTDNQFHVKINHEYIVMYAAQEKKLSIGWVVDPNTREESNLWAGIAENSITKNGPANPPSEILLPEGFPVKVESLEKQASEIPEGLIADMQRKGLSSNQLKAKYGKIQFPLRLDKMIARNHALSMDCRVFSGWANVNKLKSFINNGCEPIIDDGVLLSFYLSENGVIYYKKDRGEKARNIVSVLRNLSTTEKMRSELEGMGLSFRYPKPKELVKYIIKIGSSAGDLVLDSFAGSGTTGQAALELGAEGEKRSFILVEMEKNIASGVTAKRLKKVIKGYKNAKNNEKCEGIGGDFRYCELSAPIFNAEGQINSTVTFKQLAHHIFFIATGEPLPHEADLKTPMLGISNGVAVYLLYNGILGDKTVNGGNVLTRDVLASLPLHDGTRIIYGNGCRIGAERLKRENIIFRQIPYEVRVS